MKIDQFLQLFVVKERKFYPLFIQQTTNLKKASVKLVEMLQETDYEKQTTLYKEIKVVESEGDTITRLIYEELNRTFVTPFDREDIHQLDSKIDTFLDFIHDAAKRVSMYRPQKIDATLVKIANLIDKDADLLIEISEELEHIQKKPQAIYEKCVQIKRIEHEVDDLYELFMSDVFANEKDAIELVKLKNIVQALEDTTDRAKEVGDIIRGIIIKFA
ncbi:MAG: DUF47 family protein [Odoribacter sp.]